MRQTNNPHEMGYSSDELCFSLRSIREPDKIVGGTVAYLGAPFMSFIGAEADALYLDWLAWTLWLRQGFRIGACQHKRYSEAELTWVESQGLQLWERFRALPESDRDRLNIVRIHGWINKWHKEAQL